MHKHIYWGFILRRAFKSVYMLRGNLGFGVQPKTVKDV
jgi:hypothetical protein